MSRLSTKQREICRIPKEKTKPKEKLSANNNDQREGCYENEKEDERKRKRNGTKKEINRNTPKVQKFSSQSEKMGGNEKKRKEKRKKKEEMKERKKSLTPPEKIPRHEYH